MQTSVKIVPLELTLSTLHLAQRLRGGMQTSVKTAPPESTSPTLHLALRQRSGIFNPEAVDAAVGPE